jgi:hypothetical protein
LDPWAGRPKTSFRQFEANRRNKHQAELKSTGPKSRDDKCVARCKAARYELTVETVTGGGLEGIEDYRTILALKRRSSPIMMPKRQWKGNSSCGLVAVVALPSGRRNRDRFQI